LRLTRYFPDRFIYWSIIHFFSRFFQRMSHVRQVQQIGHGRSDAYGGSRYGTVDLVDIGNLDLDSFNAGHVPQSCEDLSGKVGLGRWLVLKQIDAPCLGAAVIVDPHFPNQPRNLGDRMSALQCRFPRFGRNCLVVELQSPVHGENVRAYITLGPGAPVPTMQDLIRFVRARIGYKAPEEIIVLEEMPLNATGKVDRVTLKRMAAEAAATAGAALSGVKGAQT